MTDEHDIARASILSAMAEETCAMFCILRDWTDVRVRDVFISQIADINNSDSLLVRMHLMKNGVASQLRFRLIGQGRKTLAWGAINCAPPED